MKFLSIWLAVALLVFSAAAAFADEMVSLKVGYQTLSPGGTFSGDSGGLETSIDMDDDIDFDDSQEVTAEIALQLGNSRLSFNYLPISFAGTGVGDFTFNGQDFSGSVKGDVSADIYDISYSYNLLNLDDLPTRLQLGFEVAVKIIEGEASLSETSTTVEESVSGTAPIPTLGLRTRVALADFIGLIGRVGYMEYDDNSFVDAEAQLEFSPFPMTGIYAGYRIFDLEVNESDLLLDVDFSGPYLGVFARF
ncbi:MAG: hypothetical protein RQ754_04585 [Desulfuromonadales bacterium]|nr:hypothetical protein [Desulfuromonadales bacterium]